MILIAILAATPSVAASALCRALDGYQVMLADPQSRLYVFYHTQRDRSGNVVARKIVTECALIIFRGQELADPPETPSSCGSSIFAGFFIPTIQPSDAHATRMIEFDHELSIVFELEPNQVVNRFKILSVEELPNNICN
jgi:hypothetical protein